MFVYKSLSAIIIIMLELVDKLYTKPSPLTIATCFIFILTISSSTSLDLSLVSSSSSLFSLDSCA